MKYYLSILFLLCSTPLCFAEDLVVEKELQANFLRINIVRSELEIEHRETSSTPGFVALGRKIKMTENSLDFILGRELFRTLPISLSLYGIVRWNIASDGEQNAGTGENIDYEEKLSGYGGGLGASLNFNFRILETRTQFFFSSQSVKQKNNYFLRYSDDDVDERSTEIETNEESTLIQTGFGMRVYNLYNGYTFNIAVHENRFTQDHIDYDATKGGETEYTLTKEPGFTRGNTAYSIGFGGTF